jgi:hypothetical protein
VMVGATSLVSVTEMLTFLVVSCTPSLACTMMSGLHPVPKTPS